MDTYKISYATKNIYMSRGRALLMIKSKSKCCTEISCKIYNYNYIIKLII